MGHKTWHKQRVVVAENNSENRRSLCNVVTSLNFEATPVCSGLGTISEVRLGRAALVLLDVDLPFLDKENTLDEIRKIAEKLPVIMMSSVMTAILARRLTDRGAQGFLLKPIQRKHLAMMLSQYLT